MKKAVLIGLLFAAAGATAAPTSDNGQSVTVTSNGSQSNIIWFKKRPPNPPAIKCRRSLLAAPSTAVVRPCRVKP